MRMMDVDKLNTHPKNKYFFDDIEGEAWTAFLESIETSGVIEPVIVSAPDLTIVSGHQRVRACKKLGIKQVAVEERSYESEDEILKQLIETNIRQRGIGNSNPVKFGRCIKELERIYSIKNGGDRKSDGNNCNLKTQSDLAKELEMSKRQMANYKSLADLIPELQDAVQSGQITATTAMGFVKKLSPEEQKRLAESISGKDKVSGKEVDKYISEIRRLSEENKRLRDDNVTLAKRNEPQVVKELVEVKVVPDDYEELKRQNEKFRNDYEDAVSQLDNIKNRIAMDEEARVAQESMEVLATVLQNCMSRHGKTILEFDRFSEIPETTLADFKNAINGFADFFKQMSAKLNGTN